MEGVEITPVITPVKKRTKKHIVAIQLRYEGKKRADIAATVGVSQHTVAHWFERGGLLYQDFQEYTAERNEEIKEEALRIAKSNAHNAVLVYLQEMLNGDTSASRVKAASELLKISMPELNVQFNVGIQVNNVIKNEQGKYT